MAGKGKLFVKIGEACKELDIQPYVLRYWETEFPPLSPDKSRSGQRVYSEEDLAIIRRIKELLYDEGFTIAGAKKKLESELASGGPKTRGTAAPAPVEEEQEPEAAEPEPQEVAATPEPEETKPAPKSSKRKPAKRKAAAQKTPPSEDAAPLRKALEDALEEARAILTLLGN